MATVIDSPEKNTHNQSRWVVIAMLGLLFTSILSMAWVINIFLEANSKPGIPLPLLSTLRPEPKPLSEFSLTDQLGKEFTLESLKGKWSFVFFGYTACPDICPTTLSEMSKVANTLASKQIHKDDVHFIFVSVDPDRDNVANMKEYMGYFNSEFVGLTANQPQLDVLMQQLSILAVREESATPDSYTMGHSSSIRLIDPQARWVASFSPPHSGSDIAEKFILVQSYYKQES